MPEPCDLTFTVFTSLVQDSSVGVEFPGSGCWTFGNNWHRPVVHVGKGLGIQAGNEPAATENI